MCDFAGQKTDFIVNTCSAGCGTLAVTIDGASKVAMDCTEVEEGYKVRYTPLVPGDYFIAVKYNGYHIAGSPFRVPCTGELLAEKGVQESSSVMVETVTKISKKTAGPALPIFKSDASKVQSKGMGLKKAYLNKQNTFQIAASDAGNLNQLNLTRCISCAQLILSNDLQATTCSSWPFTDPKVPATKCL